MIKIEKRSQAERLAIAESLLDSVCEEVSEGNIETTDVLQTAVNCQVQIGRIVWKLNKVRYGNENI